MTHRKLSQKLCFPEVCGNDVGVEGQEPQLQWGGTFCLFTCCLKEIDFQGALSENGVVGQINLGFSATCLSKNVGLGFEQTDYRSLSH